MSAISHSLEVFQKAFTLSEFLLDSPVKGHSLPTMTQPKHLVLSTKKDGFGIDVYVCNEILRSIGL